MRLKLNRKSPENLSRYLLFPIFLLLIIALFTLTKINGSSIGMYNQIFYGRNYADSNVIFGISRYVMIDEWLGGTPLIVSQAQNNFDPENNTIGISQKMSLLGELPTKHWTTFFKPYLWHFPFLPIENAFSMYWWMKGFLIITAAYFFFLHFFDKKIFFAICSSLIIFFSPFIQWWYHTSAPTLVGLFFLIISLSIKIYTSKNYKSTIIFSLLFSYFVLCFLVLIYPPFQISLALLAIFFMAGFVIQNRNYISIKSLPRLFLSGFIFCTILLIFIANFQRSFKNELETISKTEYPGKREIVGGNFDAGNYFTGFFNVFFEIPNDLKLFRFNYPDQSSFLFFFPYLIPAGVYFTLSKKSSFKKIDFTLLAITSYIIIAFIWQNFGLPQMIARLLLLNYVPENRIGLGMGIADVMLIVLYLKTFQIKSKDSLITAAIMSTASLFMLNLVSPIFKPFEISSSAHILIISIILFTTLSTYYLITKRSYLFLTLVMIFSLISTFYVHPLNKGLEPLLRSDLSREINMIGKDDPPGTRWLAYDNLYLGNFLTSQGKTTLSGTYFYPQENLWRKFDPQREYQYVYNRFSHVIFEPQTENPVFVLNHHDVFVVNVDPCSTLLKDLKVKYLIFNLNIHYPCTTPVSSINMPGMPLYIFKLN